MDFCGIFSLFQHAAVVTNNDAVWCDGVMVWAGICSGQHTRLNAETSCHSLWSTASRDLPTRYCSPAHCQDMQGFPSTGVFSHPHWLPYSPDMSPMFWIGVSVFRMNMWTSWEIHGRHVTCHIVSKAGTFSYNFHKQASFLCPQAFLLFTFSTDSRPVGNMHRIFHLGTCSIQSVFLGRSHLPLWNRQNHSSPWTFGSIYSSICSAVT